MFILLHVVFVAGLGFVLPYRLYHAMHPPVRTPAVPA